MSHGMLATLRTELERELTGRILPFWMTRVADDRNGGFIGLIDELGAPDYDAPKGGVINARILWTFSAAYRVLGDDEYFHAATRALEYFRAHFLDSVHGGVRWMVDASGEPVDERKHVYAQAFGIYAFSEYHRATGDEQSLADAIALFRMIEEHALDTVHGGYEEAFSNDWQLLDDVRLSDEDANERKSMNTHLHVLEAFGNLYRVWPDDVLLQRLTMLVDLFCGTIVPDDAGYVTGFFSADWRPRSTVVSYGHDIETSWLLLEAAALTGDVQLVARARAVALRLAAHTLKDGFDPIGGIYREGLTSAVTDRDKDWWPQAEAIVGFVNAYQETARQAYLDAASRTWEFTKKHLLDLEHGEWHRRVSREGAVRGGHEKVGPWKCPYHTARACLEVMERIERGATIVRAG